ncbi:hypothetical protein [Flavobacterium seoulense]|uniref:N-acetyltransferase domain-containing protein n=1 Tax=Flavobacterium seoulense TaxID=1492738 RepID=A0A066WJ35_9FLAO|nr:hypothetical protein [Flavobacterium seoulense]KDN54022.1 hypothetical protein FEM21_28390 [Flavobacterium seoulense]
METILKQQQNISFRAVTISDLKSIIRLYEQKQNIPFSGLNIPFDTDFGLPLYVAEYDDKIVGYSYVTLDSDEHALHTNINSKFSDTLINENLMKETEVIFKNEWQNNSNKNLSAAISQFVKWLNDSNSQN